MRELQNTTKKPIHVSILGTDYTVAKVNAKDPILLEKGGVDGYTDKGNKLIVCVDLDTDEEWQNETNSKKQIFTREIITHEVIHAFLNESGLCESAGVFDRAWSKNEEMIDWFAIQLPKVNRVMSIIETSPLFLFLNYN